MPTIKAPNSCPVAWFPDNFIPRSTSRDFDKCSVKQVLSSCLDIAQACKNVPRTSRMFGFHDVWLKASSRDSYSIRSSRSVILTGTPLPKIELQAVIGDIQSTNQGTLPWM